LKDIQFDENVDENNEKGTDEQGSIINKKLQSEQEYISFMEAYRLTG
jgi:hypothetical protein